MNKNDLQSLNEKYGQGPAYLLRELDDALGRYEFKEGSSNKFWQCQWVGPQQVEIRWGRIGTKGQSQLASFHDAITRAKEKVQKGYRHVDGFKRKIDEERSALQAVVNETPAATAAARRRL